MMGYMNRENKERMAVLAAYEDTGMEPDEIAALKRERDAAVSDLIMLGACETCAKDCGITSGPIIGCGCTDYIWRGEEGAARKAQACGNRDCPHHTGAPCPAADGCGGYEEHGVLRAQQEVEKNEPLTLEELQGMHGEPVWLEEVCHDGYGEWDICYGVTGLGGADPLVCFSNDFLSVKNYGVTWLAYRHKMKEG